MKGRVRYCFAVVRHLSLMLWFVVGVGVVSPHEAQGQSLLRFRFDSAEPASYSTKNRTQQQIALAGRTLESSIEQAMELEVSCGAPDSNDQVLVTYRPMRLTVDSVSEGERYSFDSIRDSETDLDDNSATAQSNRLFSALAESTWQVLIDQDLQVLEFRGRDDILDRLDPIAAASLKSQFDPEYLKSQAQSELSLFPDRGLRVGERWRRERELRLEAGMRLILTEECKYLGATQVSGARRHRVELKTVSAEMVPEKENDRDRDVAGAAELLYGDLDVVVSRGELIFDEQLGAIVSMTRHLEIHGPLTVTQGTRTINGSIELKLDEEQSRLSESD
jgi:hypothetical protein